MKILITGGAGFIGSHLCERFIREGHTALCVDNFITGIESNIRSLLGNPSFTLIRHDISRPLEVDGPLDFVLHFASPASPPDYLKYPIPTMKVGSLGTHNALGIAKAQRAKFLLASTSEVYGDPQVNPQPEDYWGHVNPVGPRGVYDEAKRFAEALTMAYHREHQVDTRIARIFNTYGPRLRREDGRAIPNFMTQALLGQPVTLYGDGSHTRSFCYISDLVEGICRLMQSGLHDPVNIGNPQEITLLELAKTVLRITGSASRLEFKPLPNDDPKVRCPDIALARRALGWEPKVGLEEGLRETAAWFQQNLIDTGQKIR
jgi:dTDP-glucose 4,6-dehydratase